jgi:hypothetical protein
MTWQRVGARREMKQKRCVGIRKGNGKRNKVVLRLYILFAKKKAFFRRVLLLIPAH